MKKIILALMLTLGLVACDGATDLNSFPLIQPTAEYELDTWGYNSEIYEFTTKTSPQQNCVMIMLDSGNDLSLQCTPTGK